MLRTSVMYGLSFPRFSGEIDTRLFLSPHTV